MEMREIYFDCLRVRHKSGIFRIIIKYSQTKRNDEWDGKCIRQLRVGVDLRTMQAVKIAKAEEIKKQD
jgi:hypothetical protein